MSTVRLRRLAADYENVMNEFAGQKHIRIEPVLGNPPEKYIVTYNLRGLRWNEQLGRPEDTSFHQVEIYLHMNYPREKPQFRLLTPIFHPNFSGQHICIGDYWSAGQTLVDSIIQIGEMIQYRKYNYKSPLSAQAARWARENEQYFPIGNVDLYQPELDIKIEAPQVEEDDLDLDIALGEVVSGLDDFKEELE